MINVGIVGYGLAGKVFHAPFVTAVEGLNLTAIVRRSSEPDPKYPGVRFLRSVSELLAIQEIDLVVVATPNDLHARIAKEALLAGKHVVVDKPFTSTLKEAEEVVAVAEKQHRIVTVFQNRRWDGDFMTVKQVLANGSLGRVVMFETHFDRFRPSLRGTWHERVMPGMGLLFDLGPHLVDQTIELFGTPEAVFADLRKERDGTPVDDAIDLTFYYPSMRAQLRASTMAAAAGPRYWICGDKGSYTKYGLDPQEQAGKDGILPGSPGWGEELEREWGKLTSPDGERKVPTVAGDYRLYYENVRDSILGKAQISVTTQQALDVMRALELAIASSKKRCAMPWKT